MRNIRSRLRTLEQERGESPGVPRIVLVRGDDPEPEGLPENVCIVRLRRMVIADPALLPPDYQPDSVTKVQPPPKHYRRR